MMSTEQPVNPQAIEGAKRQIRGLVDEIAQLSKQDLDPQIYYGEFLQRIVTALAAVGGAVWTLTPDRRLSRSPGAMMMERKRVFEHGSFEWLLTIRFLLRSRS